MAILCNKEHPGERVTVRRDLAQLTSQSYLDIVALGLDAGADHAWIHLDRAAFLTLLVHDRVLAASAKSAIFARCCAEGAAGEGSWWEIDNLAVRHSKLGFTPGEEAELVAWLDDVLAGCSDIGDKQRFDPHMTLDAAEALIRRHGAKDRELGLAALRKAGAAFETMAVEADGMLAGSWLQSMSQRNRLAGLAADANRVDLILLARARAASAGTSDTADATGLSSFIPREFEDRRGDLAAIAAAHAPVPTSDSDDLIIDKLTSHSGIASLENFAAS